MSGVPSGHKKVVIVERLRFKDNDLEGTVKLPVGTVLVLKSENANEHITSGKAIEYTGNKGHREVDEAVAEKYGKKSTSTDQKANGIAALYEENLKAIKALTIAVEKLSAALTEPETKKK